MVSIFFGSSIPTDVCASGHFSLFAVMSHLMLLKTEWNAMIDSWLQLVDFDVLAEDGSTGILHILTSFLEEVEEV